MSEKNRYLADLSKINLGERVWPLFIGIWRPCFEVIYGVRNKEIPYGSCFLAGSFFGVLIVTHLDHWFFRLLHLDYFYPKARFLFWPYHLLAMLFPFWCWGLYQTIQRRNLCTELTEAFENAGLENALGKFPGFISDFPVDSFTRKLRLTRKGLSRKKFDDAKGSLESSLSIYIDEIREERQQGTIEIIYAHEPMPTETKIKNILDIGPLSFIAGHTRSKELMVSLKEVPHLLVAGQTGGGKSTFLRAFITTLYLNNKDMEFTLIDLKGGLEFQLFENLKRVNVLPSVADCIGSLMTLRQELESRMTLLKENNCKDIVAYQKLIDAKAKEDPAKLKGEILRRHLVVIDEAAEMFLSNGGLDPKQVKQARIALSQIARQGRAVGINLVCATQRPDSRAIDPQVKANLVGVLCFRMLDDTSSILVLGTGRATDLSEVKGRAIWKYGSELTEVQVPMLTSEETDVLLAKYRKPKSTPLVKEASGALGSQEAA